MSSSSDRDRSGCYAANGAGPDRDASDRHGASWTLEEQLYLRDHWRTMDAAELAARLGRTDHACMGEWYRQMRLPEELRWTGLRGVRESRAWRPPADADHSVRRTDYAADDDDVAWWDASTYR